MTADELEQLCREHGIAVSLAGTIRPGDAAKLIGVSLRTLQRWRSDGTLPAVRVGRSWRIRLDDLVAFVTSREPEPSTPPRLRVHAAPRPFSPCSIHRRSATA